MLPENEDGLSLDTPIKRLRYPLKGPDHPKTMCPNYCPPRSYTVDTVIYLQLRRNVFLRKYDFSLFFLNKITLLENNFEKVTRPFCSVSSEQKGLFQK